MSDVSYRMPFPAPFRQKFDAARDPYAARNALGITGTGPGGGGAPTNAEYITAATDPTLTNERLLTDTATVTWDFSTPGQAKANAAAGGGNVSNVGTPTSTQYAKWTDATHIAGVAPATVLSDIGAAPLASPTFTGDPKAPTPTAGDNDTSIATTAFVTAAVAAAGGGTVGPPQGRLTLVSGTPVMTGSVGAATTIYYTPYIGVLVPIWDGSKFVMTSIGAELSCLLSDTTKNPNAIGLGKVNDWFVWNDAGTVRLGHGPDWTNQTTRSAGTALFRAVGIWTNNVAITNGPAQFRGTYVGTTLSDGGTATFTWGLGGSGTTCNFPVWNCYNRIDLQTQLRDSANSWTLTQGTTQPAGGVGLTAVYVCGLAEDSFFAQYAASANTGSGFCGFGIGYDSTTALSGQIGFFNTGGTAAIIASFGTFTTPPAIGRHTFTAMETAGGGAATPATVYGDAGLPLQAQNGLTVMLRM
jgi:hypothetical protein